ncbi:hypothetical protein K443DRAFT_677473 [Laccaria amethystina LaAM-08-1]|uniref:Uncharacterized protein n=1 Tax=Laccaria amethystina LaAM-08-1 TaxID=1095629 RepID=A0A0C9XY70_9AGAR|nr:hypothetical protein K443DRAFT_677473 [Laccaria amethystina LaAM-08-1]
MDPGPGLNASKHTLQGRRLLLATSRGTLSYLSLTRRRRCASPWARNSDGRSNFLIRGGRSWDASRRRT